MEEPEILDKTMDHEEQTSSESKQGPNIAHNKILAASPCENQSSCLTVEVGHIAESDEDHQTELGIKELSPVKEAMSEHEMLKDKESQNNAVEEIVRNLLNNGVNLWPYVYCARSY